MGVLLLLLFIAGFATSVAVAVVGNGLWTGAFFSTLPGAFVPCCSSASIVVVAFIGSFLDFIFEEVRGREEGDPEKNIVAIVFISGGMVPTVCCWAYYGYWLFTLFLETLSQINW